MRFVCHRTGKKLVFNTKQEYEAHLDRLRKQHRNLPHDRSRRARPNVSKQTSQRPDAIPPFDYELRDESDLRPKINPPSKKWKFSLVHPSRGRPEPAWRCMRMWLSRASDHNPIEYVISLDRDDAKGYLEFIREGTGKLDFKVVIGPNENIVQALNRGAKAATGDVLIYLSDDFECPMNWDREIQKAVLAKTDSNDWVLGVFDGHQKNTQTISIMSRTYYKRFGYMYYPDYISMWADPDFTETAKALGKLLDGFHLTFKHNHYTFGGMAFDATYEKQNSSKAWQHGEKLFYKRKANNFGVKKC